MEIQMRTCNSQELKRDLHLLHEYSDREFGPPDDDGSNDEPQIQMVMSNKQLFESIILENEHESKEQSLT